jgi:hypothetical protein
MSLHEQELSTIIPDLRDLSLEQLAEEELGESVLAHSIVEYRRRLMETGIPLNSFSARI